MEEIMKNLRTLLLSFLTCLLSGAALAQGAITFKDKQITMIIGVPAGGGTDLTGRLVAQFLTKHLPGNPPIVVRNQPGADGVTALNTMVKQTAPDGMTITFGANTQVDPFNYRKPQVVYDPSNFIYLGGVGRGGQFLVINKNALPRLHDKTKPAVIMGTIGAFPRSGMQVTAWAIEYLNWNAKWVAGYRGTPDLMLALERGEIDMTATANFPEVDRMLREGKFDVAIQSGTLSGGKITSRPEVAKVPVFASVMQGKISDPIAQQAFDYWLAINTMDKWLGMLSGTAPEVVKVYRDAFAKIANDPEFLQQGKKISEDLAPMSVEDVEKLVKTLAATSPEAISYMTALLRKQGLDVAE
jgi:tripartite-type tricarboxylate transporter receptor subunit TctC